MNTQQLELHLATSLNGLAKACETNEKTENTDRLILQVLTDDRLDGEVLLQYITEIQKETEEVCCDMFETQVNLNQLYDSYEPDSINRGKVLRGLRRLASSVNGQKESRMQEKGVLQFIYRTLGSLHDGPECSKALTEIGIIEHIYER